MLEGYSGPIFSPSQTKVFLNCPMQWYLSYQQKFQGRTYGHMEIAGAVGSAFSIFQEFLGEGPEAAQLRAEQSLTEELFKLRSTRIVQSAAQVYEDAAPDRLKKLISLFAEKPVIPMSWTLFDQERQFARWGNARVDSLYEDSMGEIGVLDYKTRGRIQKNQWAKTRREFATSDQLMHYCCMVQEELGVKCNSASILMMSLMPHKYIDLYQYTFRQETLNVWLQGRKQVWQDMQECKDGNRTPHMAAIHEDKFGDCRFLDLCFRHGFNEQLISADFLKR